MASPEDQLVAPQRAAALRHEMLRLYHAQEQRIIKRLINVYRTGRNIDHDLLVGAVAELSAMQELIDRLTREIQQAEIEV